MLDNSPCFLTGYELAGKTDVKRPWCVYFLCCEEARSALSSRLRGGGYNLSGLVGGCGGSEMINSPYVTLGPAGHRLPYFFPVALGSAVGVIILIALLGFWDAEFN